MREIRILESITPSTIGGAEVYVATLCEAIAKVGPTVELVCPAGRPFVDFAKDHGIPCTTWKTHGKVDPLTVVKLSRLIKRHRIDVIHTHLSTASLLGSYAAKMAGIPSVAHVHGLNSATCFKRSTVVVAVSEAVKEHLVAQGLDERKIRVVHNGLDLQKFLPMDAEDAKRGLMFDTEHPILGIFGRLSKEKGQMLALQAMPHILESHPKVRLVLAGKGSELHTLKDAAAALGIAESVLFTGFSSDVRTLMSACDIVIVPSIKEGFGLSALEAMALERPVVASAVGGLKEIVLDAETGFVVSPNDPSAISDRVKHLLEDLSQAKEMGRRGRERAEAYFELGHQTKILLSVMEDALCNSATP